MADVTITVDGKKVVQSAGTLLIEACKSVGIEIPSFCYYLVYLCKVLAGCVL
jgi:NADH dehydrogenase/NADH:ubiquinone oxidoreductase subunit G